MKHRIEISALLILVFGVTTFSFPTITISNQKFYIDGREYYVKGMAYSPAPLGIASMNSDGYDGGGYCSAKLTAWNEWKSACFDQDFFDGSPSTPNRVPAGPSSWFSALWQRDLPVLQELGVNTLRLYSINPMTLQAAQSLLNSHWQNITEPYGKDHIPFLDACNQAGIKVLFPLSSDINAFATTDLSILQQQFQNLIDEVGNHDAILAFVIGSDWGLEYPTQSPVVERFNSMVQFSKSYLNTKYSRSLPFTYCVSNLPTAADFYGNNLDIDFVCANAGWTGSNGISAFVGTANSETQLGNETSWSTMSKMKGWPILIGEMGIADYNTSQQNADPTWFNQLWKEVLSFDPEGVVGGVFFEFNDEPYGPVSWRRSSGATYFTTYVSGIQNSTQPNVFWADNLVPKAGIFDSIANGTLNGEMINFNMNIYAYLNRSQSIMSPISTGSSTPSSVHRTHSFDNWNLFSFAISWSVLALVLLC